MLVLPDESERYGSKGPDGVCLGGAAGRSFSVPTLVSSKAGRLCAYGDFDEAFKEGWWRLGARISTLSI